MADNIFDEESEAVNFDSSDEDVDFEGFGLYDIQLGDGGVIRNVPWPIIVRKMTANQLRTKIDSAQTKNYSPFTGNEKLNVEMDENDPINFFK